MHIKFELPLSKSIANRYLVLQWLANGELPDFDLRWPEDVILMHTALQADASPFVNVGDAGTVMRFLTALFAADKRRNHLLTGSERMNERPIAVLVNALRELGADISYGGKEGFPPLSIKGKNLISKHLVIDGSISSQYISALMMIAPVLPEGLTLQAKTLWASEPYLQITLSMLHSFGAKAEMDNQIIRVFPSELKPAPFTIEKDWSSASYAFLLALAKPEVQVEIEGLNLHSVQGDKIVLQWFEQFFKMKCEWENNSLLIKATDEKIIPFELDFTHQPDLAQTVAAAVVLKKSKARLTGLKSLRIKETDRIQALENELQKLGVQVKSGSDFIELDATNATYTNQKQLNTYGDHRMVMCLSPFKLVNPNYVIENPNLVNKSFPGFWAEFEKFSS